jgi:autotransporter-associated beta strand protein
LGNAANQVQFNAGSTAITGLDLGFSVTGYSRPLVVQNNSQWEIGVTSGNTVSISTNTLTLTGSVVTFEKFDSGTLQMSGASQFGTGGLNVAADIFDLNGYPDTISSLTSVSGANVINSSATQSLLTITGGSTTVGGAIGVTGDNNIAVNYGTTSPGLLILGQANNFTGGLTITSGTVQSQTAKNNSGVFGSGDVVIDAGAALDVNGNTATPTIGLLSGAGTVTNSGTFVSTFKLAGSAADSQTFTGVITDSGSNLNLSMSGGTETLTGANTYHGTTSLSGGTLDLTGTLVNTSGVTVTGGTLNATAINGLTGSTTLTVSNSAGTANLSGSNNYSGSTSLSAGTLIVGDPNALGDGGSEVTLSGCNDWRLECPDFIRRIYQLRRQPDPNGQ